MRCVDRGCKVTIYFRFTFVMYCILKYIDYPDFKRTKNASESTLMSLAIDQEEPANKILYFNPNCYIQLILDYFCHETGINPISDYDVCNDLGELLGVKEYKANVYGTVIFRPREMYYIVLIKRGTGPNLFEDLMPLLHHHSEDNITLIKALRKTNSLSRKASSLKRHWSSRPSIVISQASSASTTKSSTTRRRTAQN